MTEKVLVRIKGLHYIDGLEESEAEEIEVLNTACYYVRNDIAYILYDEFAQDNQLIKNMIKIGPDYLEVTKKGAVKSHMAFQKDKVDRNSYYTPQGELIMEMSTRFLEITRAMDEIHVEARYGMSMNDMFVADCAIDILVQSIYEKM